jgi:hypothetical protein
VSLGALAVLGDKMREQAPVGRLLKTHGIKLAGGLLAGVVTMEPPGIAGAVRVMLRAVRMLHGRQ